MSQSHSPPPSAVRHVPVFATMRTAYAAVFSSLGPLVKAAALPFLLSLVIAGLSLFAGNSTFLSLILMMVGFVPYTLFGVAWHRLTLLGPIQGAPEVFPAWRHRHWRFLAYAIIVTGVLYLLWLPVVIGFGQLGQAGEITGGGVGAILLLILIITVLVIYLTMRLAFVFPAVAVDETYTLRDSWAHTQGQVLRLFATLLVTALPMMLLFAILSSVLAGSLLAHPETVPPEASQQEAMLAFLEANAGPLIVLQIVNAVISYILIALMVSAISVAFRIATGWVPAPTGGPPAPQAGGGS